MILAKKFEGELWIKASHYNQAVKEAIAAEREACAKVCDEFADDAAKEQAFHSIATAEDCAAYIRARGQE